MLEKLLFSEFVLFSNSEVSKCQNRERGRKHRSICIDHSSTKDEYKSPKDRIVVSGTNLIPALFMFAEIPHWIKLLNVFVVHKFKPGMVHLTDVVVTPIQTSKTRDWQPSAQMSRRYLSLNFDSIARCTNGRYKNMQINR